MKDFKELDLEKKIQHAKDMQEAWKGTPDKVLLWKAVQVTYEEFL